MKTLVTCLIIALAGACPLPAQKLVVSLLAPAQPVAAGSPVPLDLLAVNPSPSNAAFEAAPVLHGVLFAGTRSWPVELQASLPGPAAVEPGKFGYRRYTLALPTGATGRLVLEITDGEYAPLRAVLSVATDVAQLPGTNATPLSTLDTATPALAQAQRSFLGHFSPHEPMYFIYGSKVPGAKFQFSFKYRVLDFGGDASTTARRSLQFGYTQRSLWDIAGNSSPFYDTSYMPSFFYESQALQPADGPARPVTWLGYQAGYQHESNGKDGLASRSLNTLFFRPGVILKPLDDWHVIIAPRLWMFVGDLSNNPKLKDYRGYGEWLVAVGKNGGAALAYTGHAGREFNHFTTQLDLTIPLRIKPLDFATYFLVQYYDGYGESLRDYDQKRSSLRAGFSLVR